jgi:hypothetical protein
MVMVTGTSVPLPGTSDFDFVPSAKIQKQRETTQKNSSASSLRTYTHGCNLAHRVRVVRAEQYPP